jgi:hypothetical protein
MARIEILNPHSPGSGSARQRESYGSRGGLHYTQRGVTSMAKHHKHHYKRHGNPFGVGKDELMLAGAGVVGGVGSLALPAVILPSQNSGPVGYLLNIATAFGLKLLGNMVGKNVGDGLFVGGLVGTGIRIVKDQLPSIPMGAYWPSYFSVPTVSNSIGQVLQSPYPQPALPVAAPGRGMSGAQRFAARF